MLFLILIAGVFATSIIPLNSGVSNLTINQIPLSQPTKPHNESEKTEKSDQGVKPGEIKDEINQTPLSQATKPSNESGKTEKFDHCVKPDEITDGNYYIKMAKQNDDEPFSAVTDARGALYFLDNFGSKQRDIKVKKGATNEYGLLLPADKFPSKALFSVHKNDKSLEISSANEDFGLALNRGKWGNGIYMTKDDAQDKKNIDLFVYNDTHELLYGKRKVRGYWGSDTSLYQENSTNLLAQTDAVVFCFQKKEEQKTKTGNNEPDKTGKNEPDKTGKNEPKKTGKNEPKKTGKNEPKKTDKDPKKEPEDPKKDRKDPEESSSIRFSILASFIVLAFYI